MASFFHIVLRGSDDNSSISVFKSGVIELNYTSSYMHYVSESYSVLHAIHNNSLNNINL